MHQSDWSSVPSSLPPRAACGCRRRSGLLVRPYYAGGGRAANGRRAAAQRFRENPAMRINPMRAGLARGELQLGTWVNMARNPAILPLLKAAGLDFARVDMEHSAPSMETIADMALLARAIDFPIAVRPPKANREWITPLFDAGVGNRPLRPV